MQLNFPVVFGRRRSKPHKSSSHVFTLPPLAPHDPLHPLPQKASFICVPRHPPARCGRRTCLPSGGGKRVAANNGATVSAALECGQISTTCAALLSPLHSSIPILHLTLGRTAGPAAAAAGRRLPKSVTRALLLNAVVVTALQNHASHEQEMMMRWLVLYMHSLPALHSPT